MHPLTIAARPGLLQPGAPLIRRRDGAVLTYGTTREDGVFQCLDRNGRHCLSSPDYSALALTDPSGLVLDLGVACALRYLGRKKARTFEAESAMVRWANALVEGELTERDVADIAHDIVNGVLDG